MACLNTRWVAPPDQILCLLWGVPIKWQRVRERGRWRVCWRDLPRGTCRGGPAVGDLPLGTCRRWRVCWRARPDPVLIVGLPNGMAACSSACSPASPGPSNAINSQSSGMNMRTTRYEMNLTPVLMAIGALQCWGACGVDVRKSKFLNIEGRHGMSSCVKLISYRGVVMADSWV